MTECPKSFANLYPEPSEPVFGADFPPQAKITFLHVNKVYSSLVVDNLKFLFLWIVFTLQFVNKGISFSSIDNLKRSTTDEA